MALNLEKAYSVIKAITPPIIFDTIKSGPVYVFVRNLARKVLKKQYHASWNTIKQGELAGVHLFVDAHGSWQKEMLHGEYDDFFSRYLSTVDMKGKVVYDIGAHIGYSALYFANKVGSTGSVVTFEPNPFNVERIKLILDKNKELGSRIKIAEVAVSSKNGTDNFIFSSYVDNGTSSGSFIDGAHTIYPKDDYIEYGGFKTIEVKTVALDQPSPYFSVEKDPHIIKLDIEGAEFLAVEGMRELLKRAKPLVLVEVHSIYNMYILGDIFYSLGYGLELLKEERDGRCFFAATSK